MYQEIEAGLNNQYTLSYRSSQHSGGTIAFSVRVDGLGTYKGSYRAFVASQPGQSFWSSQHLFTLAALISAALVGLAAAVLLTHFNKGESLRRRVTAYVPEAPPEPVLVPDIPATDHITELLSRRRWWPTFEQKVDVGAMKRSPKQLLYIAVGGSLLVAVLMKMATGNVLPPVGAMLAPPLLVRLLVNRAATKQRNLFLDQFPGLIHETAGAMRTGRSLVEALGGVTGNADEPSRREFTTALADERAGRHIEDALRTIGERMQCDEIEQVAVVAALHRRTGANITEVLDRVAETARQRGEIRRELRGLTAQARMSRNVLVALPPLVVFALSTIAGSFEKPLYNTTPGLILLGVCIAMIATGAKVMKAIVNIEE
jgi:tight adherence protein B